jgi:putative SOS response-associated peptidase YedK
MCGRFAIASTIGLPDRFGVKGVAEETRPRFNIAPTATIPVVVQPEGPDSRQLEQMEWGMRPPWAKPGAPLLINARAETLASRNSFRDAFLTCRCLIPATGFYEWRREGFGRRPFYFSLSSGGLFGMGGLFFPGTPSRFVIVTTQANELVSPFHVRMPAIIAPSNEKDWLTSGPLDPDRAAAITSHCPATSMAAWEVSPLVNNPANDGPNLIRPVIQEKLGGD